MFYLNIYRSNEVNFNHNEFIVKDILSCTIEEEINGIFNISAEILNNDPCINELVRGSIIKCRVKGKRKPQLFRITDVTKSLLTTVIHGSALGIADLSVNFIKDTNIVMKNRYYAVDQLLKNTMEKHRFKVAGDPNGKEVSNIRVVRMNPLKAVLGVDDDNTVINRLGGEYQFDNFNINVADQLGEDNGVIIAHRKNLTGLEMTINDDDLVTRIIPQGAEELLLPEYFIDSPKINNYEKIYHSHITFNDVKIDEDEGMTEEKALNELRQLAKEQFTKYQIDTLFFNYTINFLELSKTDEYKHFKNMESLNIGDVVRVKVDNMKVDLKGRFYKYTYNAITDQYEEIEIGIKKPDINSAIKDLQQTISKTEQEILLSVGEREKGIYSEIKSTKDSINLSVKGLNESMSNISQSVSDITLSIDKYENGELSGSTYKFDGKGFTIGSTKGDTTAVHTSNYSEWRHSSGGYSMADNSGFSRDGHPYIHLIETGTRITGGSAGVFPPSATIQLPSIFKGKNFQVHISMIDTGGGLADEVVKRTFLQVTNINHAEGTFTVRGYWTAINVNSKVENEKELSWSWMAISG